MSKIKVFPTKAKIYNKRLLPPKLDIFVTFFTRDFICFYFVLAVSQFYPSIRLCVLLELFYTCFCFFKR